MTIPAPKVQLTNDEWRKKLSPQEFAVLRQAGTERPFTGEYTDTETEGVYQCRACGAELFRSTEKFESHCGWPSFFDPADSAAVILRADDSGGMHRVEQVLIAERLDEEIHRASLHGPHRHRHVAVPGDEHHRQVHSGLGERALEVQPALAGQADI